MESVVDIKEIMELLPHRYPFILVDRVIEIVPEKSILALKNVTINEPFFQGHFPGEPVMPGVLIMEALAQAGGVLAFKTRPQQKKGTPVYFMSMDKVKFRKVVIPGDQLMLDVKVLRLKEKVIKLAAVAKVDDAVVAEAELMATFGDSE